MTSTYKIFAIVTEINEEDIAKFVMGYFLEDVRINISQLLKWCNKTPEIHDFFTIIKRDAPQLKNQSINSILKIDIAEKVVFIYQIIISLKYSSKIKKILLKIIKDLLILRVYQIFNSSSFLKF